MGSFGKKTNVRPILRFCIYYKDDDYGGDENYPQWSIFDPQNDEKYDYYEMMKIMRHTHS